MQEITYTLILEVRNKPGVLVRIAHVFARRGCNIQALHVQPHEREENWSTMTITVKNVARIEQIVSQLEKLVDIASVTVHSSTRDV